MRIDAIRLKTPRLTLIRATTSAILLLGLAGCGGDGVLGTGLGGGSNTSSGSSQPGTLASAGNYLLYGGPTPPPAIAKGPARDINCPKITVLEGTAGMRIGLATGGASEVAIQASLGTTARECTILDNKVSIRVGVEGRLLVGVLGKPGTYTVPLRIVVKRESVVLYSKYIPISVTVPAGETQASFTYVEDGILLPLTEYDPADEYDLLLGFDPNGKADAADRKKAKARRR